MYVLATTMPLSGPLQRHRRPIAVGALLGGGATLLTWLVAVRIVRALAEEMSALALQAEVPENL